VRVQGCPTPVRNESDSGCIFAQSAGPNPSGEWSECEHVCCASLGPRVGSGVGRVRGAVLGQTPGGMLLLPTLSTHGEISLLPKAPFSGCPGDFASNARVGKVEGGWGLRAP
jgi:hypothetical protein